MKDALQKRLAMMEQESPSPSLQLPEHQKQSIKERLTFGARALLGSLFVQKIQPSQRALQEARVTQEQKEAQTFEGKQPQRMHQTPLFQYQRDKLFGWKFEQDQKNRETQRVTSEIQRVKAGLWKDHRGTTTRQLSGSLFGHLIKINKDLQEGHHAPESKYVTETLEKLTHLHENVGMQFPRRIYDAFLERKGIEGAQKALEELDEYVTTNTCSVSEDGISLLINRASGWLRLGNKSFKNRAQMIEQAKEKYAREAKTVAVSEASKQYDITIVHGIPYYKNLHGKYPQFANNAYWKRLIESRDENPDNLELEDFIERIFAHKPDASTSAIRNNSEPKEFFSPFGVLIQEGRIYDASTTDVASQGQPNPHGVRMSNCMTFGKPRDISQRVREVATIPPQTHNEVIIGDNYEIGGLYFVENHHGWGILSGQLEGHPRFQTENIPYEPTYVARLANQAIQRNVPLYLFKQGEGFVTVKPEEYVVRAPRSSKKNSRKL